jgi:hypothetical protein
MGKHHLWAVLLLVIGQISHAQIKPVTEDPQGQTSPKTATVQQIPPITVDGDLSDWPSGLETRSINVYLAGFGYQQEAFATGTQDNWFQIAWNDDENKLYISGWSVDDVNVSQLSKWLNPDDFSPAGAPWLYDRYEIYIEYDNTDSGAYGYGLTDGDPGNVQYAISANDPDNAALFGQELGADGTPLPVGTAFIISNFEDPTLYPPDGRPPFSEAVMLFELADPAKPLGQYTKTFEAAITPLNFLVEGLEPDINTDTVDLGPDMNGGAGMGFDITMMDRDGIIDDSVPDDVINLSANNEGAWIGWSDGSKNANPQFDGTVFFSMEFASNDSAVKTWELY